MTRHAGTARAFTLVEVVLVLSVLAILAAIAAPRFAASISNYRATLAAHRVAADVTLTQAAARAASASRALTFDLANNRYSIAGLSALDHQAGGYAVNLSAAPYQVSIKSLALTNVTANGALTFDGFGVPNGGATVVVSSGPVNRTVTVSSATGAVTIQ
jgi:prepilin-type N-terminal cleavage/methylation domain-containing protein